MNLPQKTIRTFGFLFSFLFLLSSYSFAQTMSTQIQETQGSIVSSIKVVEKQTEEQTVQIDTPHFSVVFSNIGGKIISFRHKDKSNSRRNLVEIADPDSLWFDIYLDQNSFTELRQAHYTIKSYETDSETVVIASTPVLLGSPSLSGVEAEITKKFTFYKETHYYKFTWSIRNNSNLNIVIPPLNFLPITQIGPRADSLSPRAQDSFQNFYHAQSKFKSYSLTSGHKKSFFSFSGNKETIEEIYQNINFLGMSSRFMVIAIQPLIDSNKLVIFPPSGKALPAEQQLQLSEFTIEANQKKDLDFLIYTGPKVNEHVNVYRAAQTLKKYPELKKIHENITEAFNFGMIAPIRDAIVFILGMLYKVYPNYGVGIILFALLFRLLFYPLNEKQAQSMEKMKVLQPLLKEINEKYKEDPQEKQKRTLALYQQHKVNPLAGCLPMLIQLPIFIALYSAFSDSYELWRSPFITGWIDDLSEPDTLFLLPSTLPFLGGFRFHALPIIMAASQILQTQITNVTSDPNQKMIMQLMPIILLFIFWRMPSGVVLYWTIFNILMIGQQLLTRMRNKKKDEK